MEKINGKLVDVTNEDIKLLESNPEAFWKGVTSIGPHAFNNCESLKNIVIPESIVEISDYAFMNCFYLKSLEMADSVQKLGNCAFEGCQNLRKVKLSSSLESIGDYAFFHCKNLENLEMPDSVRTLGRRAFQFCKNLRNIKLSNSVTEIGENAFYECSNLQEINIPNSVTEIGENAFKDCESLTSVTMSDSVKAIGTSAFEDCESLVNVKLSNSLKSITDRVFACCFILKEIDIPNFVTEIGENAFYCCKNLTKVTMSDSVRAIGSAAFYECKGLENIKLSNSLQNLGAFAFRDCRSLKSIDLPEQIKNIEKYTFFGCTNLADVKLPEEVMTIGNSAFNFCENLKNIDFPDTLKEIDFEAFAGCSSLTKVSLPDTELFVGENAFKSCKNLTSLKIPSQLQTTATKLYQGKKSITCNDKTLELYSEFLSSIIKQNRLDDVFQNVYQRQINKVLELVDLSDETVNQNNLYDYINFCSVLGAFEDKDKIIKVNGGDVAVKDMALALLIEAKQNNQLKFDKMHMRYQGLNPQGFNEQFFRFCLNKDNWNDLNNQEDGFFERVYEWFMARESFDLTNNLQDETLPHKEENRYKLCVYKTVDSGIDKLKWLKPTVELFKKAFLEQKFSGIESNRDREIAKEISKHNIYQQKHFDKAKEIDKERQELGIKNVLEKPVAQGRIASLDDYRERTKALREQILQTSKEILAQEKEDTSHIFTYDVLDKSDPVNFAIGCYTNCCAKLYGAGAGAMRAMIIHPDIQPLAIRDFDGNIISFGIIYVNREEGYAVVNNFEVNLAYEGQDSQRRAIYDKALEGVKAFVGEYNLENPDKPIRKVTCGYSPNWLALNDFVRANPESPILEAPNFNDFKYAGSGLWSGDWHENQYVLWEEESEDEISR